MAVCEWDSFGRIERSLANISHLLMSDVAMILLWVRVGMGRGALHFDLTNL